jgi:predicted hydrocarbon binding protein
MTEKTELSFDWGRLGNVSLGRENLGQDMPVIVYRLLQYTLHDVLDARYGQEGSDELFRQAGFLAGQAFAENSLDLKTDFPGFIADLQKQLKAYKIGILKLEKADLETLELRLTVSEDLDCSGLPVTGDTVCVYDEGFIAGILYAYTGKQFQVAEIDCWATGDRTCRFDAKVSSVI